MPSYPESEKPDFTGQIGKVALALPNFPERQKGSPSSLSASEWRFGNGGSLALNLQADTWFDHEDQIGGGVFDLVCAFVGRDKAWEWLVDKGFQKEKPKPNGHAVGADHPLAARVPKWMDPKPVAIFEYYDDRGRLAYEVLKFPKDARTRYQQRRKHKDGAWIWGLRERDYGKTKDGDWRPVKEGKQYDAVEHIDAAERWLYRRDEVLKAIKAGKPIILCEGEKDVETLRAWGFTATTNAGGAKYWSESFDKDLAGADVVLIPDNDDAGRQRVLLRGAGLKPKAKSVRVLDLALHWKDIPEKADVSDWRDQAGGNADRFAQLLVKAVPWAPAQPRSNFGAFTWSEIGTRPTVRYDYIVDEWIPQFGRSVVGGPSQSGKSFLAIHTAMSVARGVDFFDWPTEKGGVIYQAGEGGYAIENRFIAYRRHFEVKDSEDVPLVVLPAKVDLFSREGDTDKLINEIKAWALTMAYPLRLIVIDTLATATIGADENSGKDMGVVLANIARIEEACHCHVMLVHHMNADGKKLRGHTSVHANVDTVITVLNEGGTRTAKLVKQKDGEDGKTLRFTLASVPVGYSSRREREITSCVVLTVSEKERLKREQERHGFSPNPTERRIMMNLFEAADRYGKFVASEADGPRASIGKIIVHWDSYREVAMEKMLEVEDRKKAADQIRKEFARTRDSLVKFGIIGLKQPWMWWDGKPVRGFLKSFPSGQMAENWRNGVGQMEPETISSDAREFLDSQDILL